MVGRTRQGKYATPNSQRQSNIGDNGMFAAARVQLVLVGGLAAILVLAFAACGGGDDGDALSVEAYLVEMERLDAEAEAQQAALRQQFEAATVGDGGSGALTAGYVGALEAYYVGLVEAGKDFVNAVEDLQPPDDAQDLHDEYIAAYDELLTQLNAVIDQIPSLVTSGERDALLANPDLEAAFARGNAACADLQQLATDNNVDVDFGCQA